MKFALASFLISVPALVGADAISGVSTCQEQAPCLRVKINQIADSEGCWNNECEWKICWWHDKDNAQCAQQGSFTYIADTALSAQPTEDFCPNNAGTWEWDDQCEIAPDPGFACEKHCTNVRAGEEVRFLVMDGTGRCDAGGSANITGEFEDGVGVGTDPPVATCYPSTDNPSAPGGLTYPPTGTCGDATVGEECVWIVKAPEFCGVTEYCSSDGNCEGHSTVPGMCGRNQQNCEFCEYTWCDESAAPTSAPTLAPITTITDPFEEDTDPPTGSPSGSNGDPHCKLIHSCPRNQSLIPKINSILTTFFLSTFFKSLVKTWKNEHFEYHGQCDMVLAKDPNFADGLGLDAQIRTKVVRYWSYIKSSAIRIGEDILEVEGGPETDCENRYWINMEYQGKLDTLGGFPVTYHEQSCYKHKFEIDLSSKYPGQKITVSTYKEFVRVDFENGTEESFGMTKGLLGDFKTGKTLARDGSTVMNDFWEYGNEWQVLPFEYMLFHETSDPQFPDRCKMPEDPRGDRRRRLAEATVTEELAEKVCAHLKDAGDRKDCVYDIVATQDIGMVGAY